jgi:hypothetical protein
MPLNPGYGPNGLPSSAPSPGTGFGALPIRPEDLAAFAAMTPDQKRRFLQENSQRSLNNAPLLAVADWLKANPAAPAPAAPAPAAPVAPFLTAEDLFKHNDAWKSYGDQLAAIENELSDITTNTGFEIGSFDAAGNQTSQGQIDRNLQRNQSAASDNAAGRGLYKSSIKDAELFDLEATRNLRRTFLQGQLSAAAARAARMRTNLNDWWTNFLSNENTQAVQNAANVPAAPTSALDASSY